MGSHGGTKRNAANCNMVEILNYVEKQGMVVLGNWGKKSGYKVRKFLCGAVEESPWSSGLWPGLYSDRK